MSYIETFNEVVTREEAKVLHMTKKTFMKIIEMIPIVSALLSLVLMIIPIHSPMIVTMMSIAIPVAFSGFIIFIISRRFDKNDRMIIFLGWLDLLATIYVVILYILAIISFGL